MQTVVDSRFGNSRVGVAMIPLGLLAALYFAFVCSCSLIYGDLWAGGGLNVNIVRLLLAASALFFIYVFIGGIRLLLQLRRVV